MIKQSDELNDDSGNILKEIIYYPMIFVATENKEFED